MNAVRTWIRPLYLAAYVAFLLLAFGWLPPLAGGRPGGALLFGHLVAPEQAARIGALAPLLLGLALYAAGPRRAWGRALLLPLIGVMLVLAGPLLAGGALPLSGGARFGLALLLLVPLLVLRRGETPSESSTPLALDLGTLLGGAGLTLALFALERRLGLFGYGEAVETHLHALVFLGLAAIGALLIGLPMAKGGRTLAAAGAILVAAGAWVGLDQLAPLTGSGGLDHLLRSFDLDLSQLGQLEGSGLIAARALVASAFAFGALVVGLDSRRAQASFCFGIAEAQWLWPRLLSSEVHAGMPHLVELGLGVAAAGALPLALRRLTKGTGWQRLVAPIGLLALIAGTLLLPRHDAKPLSPWLKFEAKALFETDTPLGWLTVETTRTETPILTIDRVALTPDVHQEAADAARLTAALDLMAANWQPGDPDPDVLFAGQLTLARLEAFMTWRTTSGLEASLAWTTPWDAQQPAIRPLLEAGWRLPDPLPFAEAEGKVGSGEFDLVVVPMAFGPEQTSMSADDPPRAAAPSFQPAWSGAASGQAAVVWMPAMAPLAGARLGDTVLLAGGDLDHLGVGLVHLLDVPDDKGAPLFATGPPTASHCLFRRLDSPPELRGIADRAALFERLSNASGKPFLRATSELLAAQKRSSPWAAPLERFELEDEPLEALAQATPAEPNAFERLTWNHLAKILVAKRMPAESLATLPGLLARTGRWPELEYALARADLELMLNDEAAVLLRRLFDEDRLGLIPLIEYANCLGQLDDWAGASAAFERAYALLPSEPKIERWAAIATMRAGLPGAVERIEALLAADPEDAELAAYLQPGPLPPAPAGFDPNPLWGADEPPH